jgi:O-acetyl-ADP-ribose deacetylase (regulator of RNase III)
MGEIELALDDVTKQRVDAIVNAANTTLLGGGGVDGAIHRAAGPGLLEECRKLGGCPTGEARITEGYGLAARHVIHTVGPIWREGRSGEDELLHNCYENSLKLAEQYGVKTIAFASISTGAYRFPIEHAAWIALTTVRKTLERMKSIEKVIFVCYSQADYEVYKKIMGAK